MRNVVRWMDDGRKKGWSKNHVALTETETLCGRQLEERHATVSADDFAVTCGLCQKRSAADVIVHAGRFLEGGAHA